MRVVAEVPHPRFKIQIFSYNAKYILKIELGQYEQSFKINESDVNGVEDIQRMVTTELLTNCLHRFVQMRTDWEEGFKSIKQ